MKSFFFILIIVSLTGIFCNKKTSDSDVTPPPRDTTHSPADTTKNPADTTTAFFAKGADVSWTSEMEAQNIKFYSRSGAGEDIFQVLKEEGINSIRLRAWVHPADGYNNTNDVVAKAMRAKNAGMKIMIDLHYSDTWADPGHQTKPAAWSTPDINALKDSVYNYTVSVMNALKAQNIYPDWVQVGNETDNGMLWPDGRADSAMNNFAAFVTAGYNAVKSVSDSSQVIVHISNGYDNNLFRWVFDGLKSNGAKWDIIGMSLYPTASNWNTYDIECQNNMSDMAARYNKPVMICEAGMSWTDSTACNLFLKDIISKTKAVSNNQGLGVFYWEPEAYANWQGYTLGAFDNSGKPTVALDAFK
ncbi:MAG TPA: glycosyl hydrolase 53 family protein [Chitinophagaceae bacterium]|nr:glycosyl hydrolase 53 family protein [Chitinophagaceae bacterium]